MKAKTSCQELQPHTSCWLVPWSLSSQLWLSQTERKPSPMTRTWCQHKGLTPQPSSVSVEWQRWFKSTEERSEVSRSELNLKKKKESLLLPVSGQVFLQTLQRRFLPVAAESGCRYWIGSCWWRRSPVMFRSRPATHWMSGTSSNGCMPYKVRGSLILQWGWETGGNIICNSSYLTGGIAPECGWFLWLWST